MKIRNVLLIIVFIIMILQVCNVYSNVVQIADTRDVNGKWNNWTILTVQWTTTIITNIPDCSVIDNDKNQEWYFPFSDGWKLATFIRTKLGEYAIRWTFDTVIDIDTIWSDCTPCVIEKPGSSIHK